MDAADITKMAFSYAFLGLSMLSYTMMCKAREKAAEAIAIEKARVASTVEFFEAMEADPRTICLRAGHHHWTTDSNMIDNQQAGRVLLQVHHECEVCHEAIHGGFTLQLQERQDA